MKNKILIILLIILPLYSFGQVNYAQIGTDLSNQLYEESERRKKLKRYYDELWTNTKNQILSSDARTSDVTIDKMIFEIQELFVDHANNLNRLLKSGSLNPSIYETKMSSVFIDYKSSTNRLQNLYADKLSKMKIYQDFEKHFDKVARHITGFYMSDDNRGPRFAIKGLIFNDDKSLSGLLKFFNQFASNNSSYDENVAAFKIAEEKRLQRFKIAEEKRLQREAERIKIQEEEALKIKSHNAKIYQLTRNFVIRRELKISKFSTKELKQFYKQEIKYLKIQGWKNQIKWHLGNTKAIRNIDILLLMNRLIQNEKYDYQKNYLLIEDLIKYCACN